MGEEESLKFLSRIFNLLNEGKVFNSQSDDEILIEFKHPEELKVRH